MTKNKGDFIMSLLCSKQKTVVANLGCHLYSVYAVGNLTASGSLPTGVWPIVLYKLMWSLSLASYPVSLLWLQIRSSRGFRFVSLPLNK